MGTIAVIDTETTWKDEVMSIGVVTTDDKEFSPAEKRYYVLTPFKNHGGMYSNMLYADGIVPDIEGSRQSVMNDLLNFLLSRNISDIFAYNAIFDFHHLPELRGFFWYDIMKLAAYRQFNKKIPVSADTYSTGKLKRGYGVEEIYRMLSGDRYYREIHNALTDAADELDIMRMLGIEIGRYTAARIT